MSTILDPVCICIPVYNGQETISETLSDILKQTHSEFEVIVYDDGSTDNTAKIVSDFANQDTRIKLHEGGENRGRGYARNALLELTAGRLITWQDADDFWHPRKLEEQKKFYAKAMESFDDPIILSTYALEKVDKDDGEVVEKIPPTQFDLEYILSDAYQACHFQLQAVMGPSDRFRTAGGFDENLNWSEDIDIAMKILKSGGVIVGHAHSEPLARYRHSIRHVRPDLVQECQNIVRDRFRSFAAEQGIDIDAIMDWRSANYIGRMYVNRKRFPKALALYVTAMKRLDPSETDKILHLSTAIVGLMKAIQRQS